jgi:hypothetical protein
MKSATIARKAPKSKKPDQGKKMKPEQFKLFKKLNAEMDAYWGDRDTGSVKFLLKMRRGEI